MWKRLNNALPCLLVLLLAGCAGNTIKRAETLQLNLPQVEQQVRVISPEARAQYSAAIALLRDDKTYEAREALQQLLKISEVPGAYLNLALLDYHEGFYSSARHRLSKALELMPRNAAAYNLSGTLHRHEGEFKQAWEAYALALQADEDYAPAHLNLAILFDIYLQYWLDARTHYQRYLDLHGEDPQVTLWLQDLERRIKRAGG